MTTRKYCILIDGTAYVYRAFFALPPLTSPDQHPTGVIYGVVNMIKRLVKSMPDAHYIVVFDPKGPTTRHGVFPAYKANRTAAPDDLIRQIKPLMALIQAYGWPVVCLPGIEADDVIGTFAIDALGLGYEVLISSGDKDFAQLVQPHLSLVNHLKARHLDSDGVLEKFGVRPDQIIDYLALVGDSADNIPGVEKVGPKTAVKWLKQWGSLDAIIAHAEEISGKVGENLRASLDQLALYRTLVTIDTKIALPQPLESYHQQSPDLEALQRQLSQWGFHKWLDEVNVPDVLVLAQTHYEGLCIETLVQWSGYFDQIKAEKKSIWVYQFDQSGPVPVMTHLCSMLLSGPVISIDFTALQEDLSKKIHADMRAVWADQAQCLITYQFKPDRHILEGMAFEIHAQVEDLELMAYVLQGTQSQQSLRQLSERYLASSTVGICDAETTSLASRLCHDVQCIAHVYPHLLAELESIPEALQVFREIEMPLQPILVAMERHGVLLDIAHLKALSQTFSQTITQLEQQVHDLAGGSFNLASPKQLSVCLYETLQLPVLKKTPAGVPSTAEHALSALAAQGHIIADLILEHRHLSKLKNTYTDRLPEQVDADHRVHCAYNQALTTTGRLSSQGRICKIFQFGQIQAARFVKLLLRRRGMCYSVPIILKLSCGLWRIYQVMRIYAQCFNQVGMCTLPWQHRFFHVIH